MAMKMEDVIQLAKASGLEVQYTKTYENGWTRIRVTMVGSVKYKESAGNTALREKMGLALSHAERKSLKEANTGTGISAKESSYQRSLHKRKTAPKLTKSERNAIAKNNRMVKKTGKGSKMSYAKARNLKAERGHWGVLDQAQRHYLEALGLAYPYYINSFIDFLNGEENYGPEISLENIISYLEGFVKRRKGGALGVKNSRGLKHDNVRRAWEVLYNYHQLEEGEMKKANASALKILKEGKVDLR